MSTVFSPSPRTAAVERFPNRKLSISIPDDIVLDQEDHKKKLTQSLRQRWEQEIRRFKDKTGFDLGSYKNGQVSKTGVLSTLNKQYGSDSKDQKKRDEVYGTIEKIINGVELVGAIAAQAASVVFGPAQMCFNALDILFSIPKAMKSFHEELSKLFREVKDYLAKFNVYDRIDQRGMLDVALVTSNNEILVAFVDLCMLAWHAVEHKTSFMLGKVFLNESPISAAVDNFGELIKKQNELTSTMTLEAVLENGALTRKILSRYTRLEETTKRIEDSVKDGNVVGKDTNVVVKGLAADNLESKNLKVDRDRILKIDKALDLTDAMVNDPLESLRLAKKLLYDEILEVLKGESDFTDWDDYDTADEAKARKRLLYIGGEASTGKTKLLSALVQRIDARRKALHEKQQEARENKSLRDDRSIYVVYYSFVASGKGRDREKRFDTPVHTALKAMAAQLARQSTRYANALSDILEELQKRQMTLDEIWAALKMHEYDAPAFSVLYMFFDGLDQLKSSLPELGKIFKTPDAQKKAKDSESGKLRLRVVFTGKPDNNKKLDLDSDLPMINIANINTPLIKSYVDVQLQDRTIFQDDDEASRERRAKVLDLIPSNCNGSFDVADQKLKLLETAIEKDRDSDELMSDLESATFNSVADEGRKILEKLSIELSEQHRAQLRELLIWTIYAERRPELGELEGALYLQRNKTSLEPLRRKITGRFEEALELIDDYVYPRDPIEEAIKYSDYELSTSGAHEDKPKILVDLSLKNADESSLKQFVRDLNQRISDGAFDFSSHLKQSEAGMELFFGPGVAELTIVSRLLRALNDDRVRRQTVALVRYACRNLPPHLERFQDDYMVKTPLQDVVAVAKGLVNFLSDSESIAYAWDSLSFEPYEWLSDSAIIAIKTILQHKNALEELDPIERRWAIKHTEKTTKKASFYETLLRVVAEKWLIDRAQKASARDCYSFIIDYLDMLVRPDTSISAHTTPRSSQQSSLQSSRTSSPARSEAERPDIAPSETEDSVSKEAPPIGNGILHGEPEVGGLTPSRVAAETTSLPTANLQLHGPETLPSQISEQMKVDDEVLQIANGPAVEKGPLTPSGSVKTPHETNEREEAVEIEQSTTQSDDNDSLASEPEKKRSQKKNMGCKIPLLGNFSASSYDIDLLRNCLLMATCRESYGSLVESSINLNECLGVRRGRLRWERDGKAFSEVESARLLSNGKILEVTLYRYAARRRNYVQTIRLDEQISNDNGKLVFLDTANDEQSTTDTASSYVYVAQNARDKVKKAEEWALSILNIKLDSFALIRLGYTLLDIGEQDAAIEYFDQAISSPPSVWKHIGLSRAYSHKEDYNKAVDSLKAALSIFERDMKFDKHGNVKSDTDEEVEDYEEDIEVKDLFTCFIRLADYYNKLENGSEAMQMMEKALHCRPRANRCRWKLMELACRNDRQSRAVEIFEDWKSRHKDLEIESPGTFILTIISDLHRSFHEKFAPMVYLSRGTTLLKSLQTAIKETLEREDPPLPDADNVNLLYAEGVLFAVDGGSENLDLARISWLKACDFSRGADLESYITAPEYAADATCMVVFDRLRDQYTANPTGPWNTEGMLHELMEESTKSAVPQHDGSRPYELPLAYVASLGRIVGSLKMSREVLKADMKDAITILTDEDIYNDVTGIEVLIKVLIHYGDSAGAMSAWSLLDRMDNRARIKRQKEEAGEEVLTHAEEGIDTKLGEPSQADTAAAQAETTGDANSPPPPPASDAGSAVSVPGEVDKWLTEYCVVCDQSMRSYEYDEFWWCKFCPETTIFCTECYEKLITNKLESYVCNSKHEHILMKHPEVYTEAELEGTNVCVGWEWQITEVTGPVLKEEMILKHKQRQETLEHILEEWKEKVKSLQEKIEPYPPESSERIVKINAEIDESIRDRRARIVDLRGEIEAHQALHEAQLKEFDTSKSIRRHERVKEGTIIGLDEWMARLRTEWNIEVTKIEGTVQQ